MPMPDSPSLSTISSSIATAFVQGLSGTTTDWNYREKAAWARLLRHFGGSLPQKNVYLGGDALRPYLSVRTEDLAWVATVSSESLHCPKFLSELYGGQFGYPTIVQSQCEGRNVAVTEISLIQPLRERLAVPTLYLASLTNASRYQARRYPLNIARLAQWVRFQHCARAIVLDLPLTLSGNIRALAEVIIEGSPDILGISVNFGELEALKFLMSLIKTSGIRPQICLGNVLAAWAQQEVKNICAGFEVTISPSYGEHDIEMVCRSAACNDPKAISVLKNRTIEEAETVVVPDELLMVKTIMSGGQMSIETSFGCQYSRCTFCPRTHRGASWYRSGRNDAIAVVDYIASSMAALGNEKGSVLSIVDEDAFGTEESRTFEDSPPIIVDIIRAATRHGIPCEIYARLDQIFNRRRASEPSIVRFQQLRLISPALKRFFVGVESGADSQLRRYGKGQSASDIVDALRAGSLLGLPLEFGFITFDPLLTADELLQNLRFLGRKDILFAESLDSAITIDRKLRTNDSKEWPNGIPVFMRVAYMATELELFANSPFKKMLANGYPELLRSYDVEFARYNYCFRDPVIGHIASLCRVWTEGTFNPIYRIRLASRSAQKPLERYDPIVRKYRHATFALLLTLAHAFGVLSNEEFAAHTSIGLSGMPLPFHNESTTLEHMKELWRWVAGSETNETSPDIEPPNFNLDSLDKRRAN